MNTDAEHHSRLGKRELGRHAFEEQMPDGIKTLLDNEDAANSLFGVVPNLARLAEHNRDVRVAWLCTDSAVQVCKLPGEGAHFCGYRNIQMLCLALGGTVPGFTSHKLTIPQLQDMIESAWSMGFNAHGSTLTGGIKGTRKHIGTSEAEALLLSLSIPCTGNVFSGEGAWHDLLDFVGDYFASSASELRSGVHCTAKAPIFLQRPNHSITIVGIVVEQSGKRHLLTFDPAWQPPSAMRHALSEPKCTGFAARWLYQQYRKSERYLKRFSEFETLSVDAEALGKQGSSF